MGVISTMGMFSTVGDILSTMGCSILWGYHEYFGGYFEYCGVFSTMGDIMMHVGENHEYCGGVQYHGGIFCYLSTPPH